MIAGNWPCPLPSGGTSEEYLLSFNRGRGAKVLMIPPLFDEHNKLRAQIVLTMRALDRSGVDSALPGLPGWNESLEPLETQRLASWRDAVQAAADFLAATHVLSWRAGALLLPPQLTGLRYAPLGGASQLRGMMRARLIAAREAGRTETIAEMEDKGRADGIELVGWHIGSELFRELEAAEPVPSEHQPDIDQSEIGGASLWLRAEPDTNPSQAEALAAMIVERLR